LTGAWCRSNQEKANAFADHLRSSFQPFDLCDPEELQETLHFLDVACPMDLPIPEIDCEKIKDLTSLKPKKKKTIRKILFFVVWQKFSKFTRNACGMALLNQLGLLTKG